MSWRQQSRRAWRGNGGAEKFVVCTGGEPLLQSGRRADRRAACARSFPKIAVETNGTLPRACRSLDWLCVSPKANADLAQRAGDELKLVYPQDGADPARY